MDPHARDIEPVDGVVFEHAAARPLVGVRRRVRKPDIPRELLAGLDIVWPFLRGHGVTAFGHNVALYREVDESVVELTAGVEVADPPPLEGELLMDATPPGRVAHATHLGRYDRLGDAYDRIFDALRERGISSITTFWEVYGDPTPDPATTQTDVFVLLEADVSSSGSRPPA